MTDESFLDSWTVKDLLAHVAGWDCWENGQMGRLVASEEPEDVGPEGFNKAFVDQWKGEA